MFGISMWEVVLILVVALIVLGPRQLTEVAKAAGRFYRELHKMAWDVRNSMDLDSIDRSLPPSPPRYEPPLPKNEPVVPELPLKDMPSTGQRTGPDFYAELLERSKEEDELEKSKEVSESKEENHVSTEAEKPVSETLKI
ncbi:MAG: twin-arginine translocase TatA/TatE family subunit [Desulfomonile tiedjei]|uniref:Twin-arginine translocase TatA/TatE family subunit n=1 Tax=Desulfomonile tiedjei TaxID=2358 RepID=A0A9D6Z2R7_9BACT|nr:twin-arginine translocase TatA/TatE family subunit [Desulfomonile tiedjei]